MRPIRNPALTKAQRRALSGAPLLDPPELDQFITDVQNGRAVYNAAALRAEDQEWFDYNTEPAVQNMGPRAPILRWPDDDL